MSDEVAAERLARITNYFLDRVWPAHPPNANRVWLKNYILRHPEIGEKVGLPVFRVSDDVHVMGQPENIGDLFGADMFDDVVSHNGVDIAGSRILDFGCSSGRLVRILANYYKNAAFYGCDPRQSSIDWVRAEVPNVRFFVNDEAPPLPIIRDDFFKVVIAVSIWTHFSAARAIEWFTEMHRVIQEDGALIFSAAGEAMWNHFHRGGRINEAQRRNRVRRTASGEYMFVPIRGNNANKINLDLSHWGTTVAGPAWYLPNLGKAWKILEYLPGRIFGVQDVYVARPVKHS